MDLSWRFDRWFARLPDSPREEGRVCGIVIRPTADGHGGRRRLEEVELSVEGGLAGDRWAEGEERTPDNQVSLMNVHVLRSLAGDDLDSMARSGDNLHVDLELSEENLPVGTRLSVGGAILEVSPMPHRPCEHFVERFGATGAKKVARAGRIGLRGRGVLCRVASDGLVRSGDVIRVLR
ncbi:MAG: MOSC domain-containing protein [Planctomycetota bacterium]|nr:MOSC domain-containing protein [Planctomycetota bacterium]